MTLRVQTECSRKPDQEQRERRGLGAFNQLVKQNQHEELRKLFGRKAVVREVRDDYFRGWGWWG